MIRRTLLLGTTLLFAAPLRAQVVGHIPAESPFEDLRGRMAVTVFASWISPGTDPAHVGPAPGPMVNARYELLLVGPLWLNARLGLAPALERTVKDPLISGAGRIVGTREDPLLVGDIGFGVNITGNKSWKRITPQLHGGLGFVSDLNGTFDVGGYRFGSKFLLSYGLGVRYVTGTPWELRADLTHQFWQYRYPLEYRGPGGPGDTSILGPNAVSAWSGNVQFSLGVSRYFFR